MTKSGLADSPFFSKPAQKEPATPLSGRYAADQKREKRTGRKESKRKTTVDRPTSKLTDQSVDQSTDQSTGQLTEVEAFGPIVARPRAFYITQKVDRWLDEAVRYLKDQGYAQADRSVLINAILHDPELFTSESLDAIWSKLLAHLTNKSLKRPQSTE